MSRTIFTQKDAFRFIKVQKYFERFRQWGVLTKALDYTFNSSNYVLGLTFNINGDSKSCLQMEFIDDDIFRLRFNPSKTNFEHNTRHVIQDSSELRQNAICSINRRLNKNQSSRKITCQRRTTQGQNGRNDYLFIQCMKGGHLTMVVLVYLDPFQIEVKYIGQNFNGDPLSVPTVWRTALPGLYYTSNGRDDYAIIQAIEKPANAKYVGFGEQGGICLSKNASQLNYFNFDNMRYMQVYDKGPLDSRQPLYHSEPLFFQYNSVPGNKITNAVFVANPGQVLMDLGYSNSQRYMIGTRYGDMDYYYFVGQDTKSLVYNFTSVVGRSALKPRYILGYHQGCYGYQRRDIVQWAVKKHREYQIPLDGMHIDVDIQHKYQTFTIDSVKFPNPQQMFTNLRRNGIKCSTNITPVISREDDNYQTYRQARDKNYFVLDYRYDDWDPQSRNYQLYGGGNQYQPNDPNHIQGFNSGQPFIGGVYYGNQGSQQLGTSGHYPDFGRSQVRKWWGTQYKYLMNSGLEFVWQDMTTPAIRDRYGDMKSFPARLMITQSYYKNKGQEQSKKLTPFIRQWNLYSYNLHKATFHGLNELDSRINKRNFIIGRGSFTGSHVYSGLWTGDNSSTWDFLRINVSQALSLGMCGVAINGQDIGGFEQDKDFEKWANPELLIRWTCAGAFLPWFRNHYVRKGRKQFQEIFMYEQYFTQRNLPIPEPQDLYRMVLPICRHYIQLRYRLLQMFYDCMFENTLTGLPICRPLFFEAQNDESLFNDKQRFLNNSFFVGNDMLVAPILWPRFNNGVDTKGLRDVYLPSGFNYYHFKNNTQPLNSRVEGGSTIRDFNACLNSSPDHINFIVPIYIKEGGIIPTIQLEQYVGQLHDRGQENPITFNIYPGNYSNQEQNLDQLLDQSQGYTCYLDDGVSRSSASTFAHPISQGGDKLANNQFRQTKVTHVTYFQGQDSPLYSNEHMRHIISRNVLIKRERDGYEPIEKYFFVALLHSPEERVPIDRVTINDQGILQIDSSLAIQDRAKALWQSNINSWYYNESLRTTFVKVFDTSSSLLVVAHYQN